MYVHVEIFFHSPYYSFSRCREPQQQQRSWEQVPNLFQQNPSQQQQQRKLSFLWNLLPEFCKRKYNNIFLYNSRTATTQQPPQQNQLLVEMNQVSVSLPLRHDPMGWTYCM